MNRLVAPWRTLALLAVAGLLLGAAGCTPKGLRDPKLQGTWKAVAVDMEGQPLEGKVARNIEVTFANNDDMVFITDGEAHKGVCDIDTSASPKRLTLKPAESNLNDQPLFAIYAVDSERQELSICFSHRRTPPGFATKPGYDYVLVKFKKKPL
ncbi:MAG: TIGR03067 domain-containing protein [Planctomycetia bacterium]|nr:TIGR03067 domain-containing protein [Planctomycetia bacterium]